LLDLRIQFHDGEILDIRVEITRCRSDLNSNKNSYSGIIEQGISVERISKEQAYLLNHFPDFAGTPGPRLLKLGRLCYFLGKKISKTAPEFITIVLL